MNKPFIKLFPWLCLIWLLGCSTSSVQQVRYFVLTPATTIEKEQVKNEQAQVVQIASIKVADYLRQSNLAMQLDEHEIYYSRRHAWAEPLDKGIQKALLNALNGQTTRSGEEPFVFVGSNDTVHQSYRAKVSIEFDHFIATDDAQVIANGTIHIAGPDNARKSLPFALSKPLLKDGYGHAVLQLAAILSDLGHIISTSLANSLE